MNTSRFAPAAPGISHDSGQACSGLTNDGAQSILRVKALDP